MNDYSKKPNESVSDYIGRICSQKAQLGLTWFDLEDIFNFELNENLSERTYRRRYEEWLENQSNNDNEYNELLEIKKERIKLKDEIAQINNLVRLEAREEHMWETAIEAAKEAAKIKPLIVPANVYPKKYDKEECDKVGIIAIGDWHYGIDIDVFYNLYNPDICRRRVKMLASQCKDIIDKEKLEEVYVINLGDMISGRIHLPLRVNSRCDVVTQTMEVSELIADFLTYLSNFVKVNYGAVSDNHSRVEPKKKESLQTEAFSRIIDWYLQERLKTNTNIDFLVNEYDDDICTFDVFNHRVACVHGDKDKTNKVITNLNMFTQEHLDLILTAHMHHFSADESNETIRLCNGSLMGCDDFASNLRLNSLPSQLFIVSNEKNVLQCMYKINVNDY